MPFRYFAWVSGIIGLALAWIAAVAYLGPARQALRQGREGRAHRPDGTRATGTSTMREVGR